MYFRPEQLNYRLSEEEFTEMNALQKKGIACLKVTRNDSIVKLIEPIIGLLKAQRALNSGKVISQKNLLDYQTALNAAEEALIILRNANKEINNRQKPKGKKFRSNAHQQNGLERKNDHQTVPVAEEPSLLDELDQLHDQAIEN